MSIGTRIARHGSTKIRTAITSTSYEPLLFLYPGWARSSSTAADSSYLEQLLSDILPRQEASKPQIRDCSKISSSRVSSNSQSLAVPKRSLRELEVNGQLNAAHGFKPQSSVFRDELLPDESSTVKRVRRLAEVSEKKKQTYQRKVENRRTWQAQRNEALKRDWDPDWRVVLQELSQRTPHHGKWLKNPITLEVPPSSLSKLMDGLNEDIWTVAERHDCVVKICRDKVGEKTSTAFRLSGSPVAISRTTAHLLRIVPGIKVKASLKAAISDDSDFSNSQDVVEHSSRFVASNDTLASSMIVNGSRLRSQASFLQHVQALTGSKSSNHINRLSNMKDDGRVLTITTTLHELFTSPTTKRFVSTKAVKEALSFYMSHNNVAAARSLFNDQNHEDLEMFNIMLRRPAANNDIHNFHYILNLMDRRGHRPNLKTWIAFLEANKESLEIQLAILSAMRSKGLIQHMPSVRAVANILAPPMIELELSKGLPLQDIVRKLDERFGAGWLNLSTSNRVLHELGTCGVITECYDFLQIMALRGIVPDVYSINTVLHHCEKAHTLQGAIEFLRLLPSTTVPSFNGETYQILFEMTWQSRNYNVARVLWKYACLSLNVTPRMRALMHRSLQRSLKLDHSDSTRIPFEAGVCRFILASPSRPQTLAIHGSSQDHSKTVSAGAPTVGMQSPSTRLTDVIHREMMCDLNFTPAQPLEASLTEAFAMDARWKDEERVTGNKKSLESMLESRMKIRLRWKTDNERLPNMLT